MEPKKTSKADLENKRSMFFLIGLILALGAIVVAFEWDSKVTSAEVFGKSRPIDDEWIELPPITKPEELKKELPRPVVVEIIEIVDDKSSAVEDVLDISSEATAETKIEPVIIPEEAAVADEPIFLIGQLDENPEFPGGELGLRKYLNNAINYPVLAQERGIMGTVFLTFVINKHGKVENVRIMRGVDELLDKEALRVVNTLPDWKPGKQNGKPVKVSFQVPIKFQLSM
jgi:protein TonB